MERPRITLDSTKKTKLKIAGLALLTILAASCNRKSPQDIVSGILTDGDNRREANKIWLTYQEYEKSSDNPTDTYELRALQKEELTRRNELTESRNKWIKELWKAERKEDREEHKNSVNWNSKKDPLNWQDVDWNPREGEITDKALRSTYHWE